MATTFRCIRFIQIVQESYGRAGTKAGRVPYLHSSLVLVGAGPAPPGHCVLAYHSSSGQVSLPQPSRLGVFPIIATRRSYLPNRETAASRRMVSAHSVNPGSRRRRRRAYIEIACRSRVMPPRRTKQELPDIQGAASNIASNEIGIHCFECGRRENPPRQHRVSKPRRETLNLTLQPRKHVQVRSVRDVAVGPGNVLPFRRARGVEQAWLCQQNERTLGVLSAAHLGLGGGYVRGAATEVHGGSLQAFPRLPRNRTGQGIVHLEGSRTVTKCPELALIACRQSVARYSQQLSWRHIA